jgi:hypothetical protein
MMTRLEYTRYLLLLVYFLMHAMIAEAYPSWLKCFVEFDESEVIMNAKVTPLEKAEHKVELEVKEEGGEWTTDYQYTPDSIIHVRLKIPKGLEDPYSSVQFVLETTSDSAEFVEGGRMCDGKRAFSGSEPVTLKIGKVAGAPIDLLGIWATGKLTSVFNFVSWRPKYVRMFLTAAFS